MKTIFRSNQYNITQDQLSEHFDNFIEGVQELNLWDILVLPAGHGHYSVKAEFEIDSKQFEVKAKTSNMQLIDAWKSGINDNYEDGEDGFDSWGEVVESMLSVINPEDEISDLIN